MRGPCRAPGRPCPRRSRPAAPRHRSPPSRSTRARSPGRRGRAAPLGGTSAASRSSGSARRWSRCRGCAPAGSTRSGTSGVPGNGAGLATPQYTSPALGSTAGGYHAPPPEFTSAFPQRSSDAMVSNNQSMSPVLALSAYSTPRSPPWYGTRALTGTVAIKTLPFTNCGCASTPSVGVSVRSRFHRTCPLSCSSAIAPVGVVAKTAPSPTLTPCGPMVNPTDADCHFTAPVARSIAVTMQRLSSM